MKEKIVDGKYGKYMIKFKTFNNLYCSDVFLALDGESIGYCIIQFKDKDAKVSEANAVRWIEEVGVINPI